MKRNPAAIVSLVALAILAFAGNSLLTRAALANHSISAESFMLVRLFTGAGFLMVLTQAKSGQCKPKLAAWPGDWLGVLALSGYMIGFTLAYKSLGAATGALILFGSVQLTVFWAGVASKQRPKALEWLGAGIALAGLGLLLAGGLKLATPWAMLAMVFAGVSWGWYTLLGRGAKEPLALTAKNFIGATFLAFVFWLTSLTFDAKDVLLVSGPGLALAVMSGMLCSGAGYAIWYAVLPSLSRATAGVSQLLVPPVAALIATVVLGESLAASFYASLGLIVLGVILTILAKK